MTSMKLTVEVELEPFDVPSIAKLKGKVGTRQEGFTLNNTIPLSEIDADTLDKMCEDFKSSVFKRAGKEMLPKCE